jgi:hypothetical protein
VVELDILDMQPPPLGEFCVVFTEKASEELHEQFLNFTDISVANGQPKITS